MGRDLFYGGQGNIGGGYFVFNVFVFITGIKIVFFSKLWIVLFLSCHAPDSKSSYIKDRLRNLTSFLISFNFFI